MVWRVMDAHCDSVVAFPFFVAPILEVLASLESVGMYLDTGSLLCDIMKFCRLGRRVLEELSVISPLQMLDRSEKIRSLFSGSMVKLQTSGADMQTL
jgi:hypothetical protein